MNKKIMLFFAVCLVILPVNIKAAKVDSNKVDSKYAVTIGSVECKKKKCQFNNVRGGSGVAKARITMYSDSSTNKELSSGEVKKGINDDCDNNLKEIIKKYWKWVMFLTPILLIVMITLDFLKAMTSGDSDSIKKSSNDAFKRVIAAIVLIMLPWALSVIFGWFGLNICF